MNYADFGINQSADVEPTLSSIARIGSRESAVSMMLSYRHAFHAGNFADVLKHLVLIHILEHLKKKDKPFCYVDTHAGPGTYDLNSEYALKNREFDNGIGKLWRSHDCPAPVADYVRLIRSFNHGETLRHYPGSPLIAQRLLMSRDRLFCYELHSTEMPQLARLFKKDRRITCFHANGLVAGPGLLPPIQRRGVVLIDPSYEIKTDYEQAAEALIAMYKRFPSGIFALWYPVVDRNRVRRLEGIIAGSRIKDAHLFELSVCPDHHQAGMTGCGMIVVNPPWTLAPVLADCLPWLSRVLAWDQQGSYKIVALTQE